MTDERVTRGRKGRIDALDDDVQDLIHRHLRGGLPLTEICRIVNGRLKAAGDQPISYSSLSRHAQKIERIAWRVRKAQEMAQALRTGFGEDADEDMTAAMVKMLQAEVLETVVRMRDEEGSVDADTVNQLALGMQRLARAAEISAKRAREIRREAAEAAAAEAKRRGLSAEAVDGLRAYVEGRIGA